MNENKIISLRRFMHSVQRVQMNNLGKTKDLALYISYAYTEHYVFIVNIVSFVASSNQYWYFYIREDITPGERKEMLEKIKRIVEAHTI